MTSLLSIEGVEFRYGKSPVLNGVSLDLQPGTFLGLVGPNGSGKTTLLRLAAGLEKPNRGTVKLRGKAIERIARAQLARQLALLPQKPHLPGTFTAWELVMMGRTPFLGFLGQETQLDMDVVDRAMELADCRPMASRKLDELSGGEIQRVLMARALAQQPELLLLDEPTAHMDMHHQIAAAELIVGLVKDGMTALGVFHDLNLAACYCDRIAVLSKGRVVAYGTAAQALTSDVLMEAFGSGFLVTSHPTKGVPVVLPNGGAGHNGAAASERMAVGEAR